MRITVYSAKGSAGKTPIATNIALDREYAIGTNEHFHVFDGFIPDDRLLILEGNQSFPEIPQNIDIVFDLAGSITENSLSIISALKQSELVIVPIFNEVKCLNSGIGTIREIARFTTNILVVATKLQRHRKDHFTDDWTQGEDFKNIKERVSENIDFPVTILPLRFSTAFDAIFEKELSIRQIMEADPLARYSYREVSNQFDEIYKYIDERI
ncbi:MAG: hypothetical protein DHS20C09_18970 [marine bacterium B5-7]|nr:MAG: hypothetical protein DHS20C09_18970 [marine bacterium B5-7]